MLRTRSLLHLTLRWKYVKSAKRQNTDRALENFDSFYNSVFGTRWKNIRAALLTERKYVAIVNNFADTKVTCPQFELDGAVNMKPLVENKLTNMDLCETIKRDGSKGSMSCIIKSHTRSQELQEINSLYPKGVEQPIKYDDIPFIEASGTSSDALSSTTAKTIERPHEDIIALDDKRLVDPEKSLGGLYEFVPANKIKGMEDWIPESHHYRYYQTKTDFPLKFELQTTFTYPAHLVLYTYEKNNCSTFRQPRRNITKVLSHYLLDGASVLAPLLLGVEEGDRVIDVCAAPGGKSLLILQTLYPDQLVCNDIMESRINRIRHVMQDYLFDYHKRWEGNLVLLQQSDARHLQDYGSYDKVLVDVPCTTDRHSVIENDNNIFKPSRIKERLCLPQLQAEILANSMRLLKKGGSLVYSTCTLSPVQNDGVVHMALQKVFDDFQLTYTIKDLSPLLYIFDDIYHFENPTKLKYGQMVLPNLTANFGPMYICKMTRDE